MQQVHSCSTSGLQRSVLASQVALAASGTRLAILAFDASFGTSLTSMGDATCARCCVDAAFLVRIAIVVMIVAVALQEIGASKTFAASLQIERISVPTLV